MNGTMFFLMAVITIAFLFNLVRSRRLREKYVALSGWWSGWPPLSWCSSQGCWRAWRRLVESCGAVNLLFFLAILLLLGVCLQLSLEISLAEEKSRTLAEHVAILNLQMRELTGQSARITPAGTTEDELEPSERLEQRDAVRPGVARPPAELRPAAADQCPASIEGPRLVLRGT